MACILTETNIAPHREAKQRLLILNNRYPYKVIIFKLFVSPSISLFVKGQISYIYQLVPRCSVYTSAPVDISYGLQDAVVLSPVIFFIVQSHLTIY